MKELEPGGNSTWRRWCSYVGTAAYLNNVEKCLRACLKHWLPRTDHSNTAALWQVLFGVLHVLH